MVVNSHKVVIVLKVFLKTRRSSLHFIVSQAIQIICTNAAITIYTAQYSHLIKSFKQAKNKRNSQKPTASTILNVKTRAMSPLMFNRRERLCALKILPADWSS